MSKNKDRGAKSKDIFSFRDPKSTDSSKTQEHLRNISNCEQRSLWSLTLPWRFQNIKLQDNGAHPKQIIESAKLFARRSLRLHQLGLINNTRYQYCYSEAKNFLKGYKDKIREHGYKSGNTKTNSPGLEAWQSLDLYQETKFLNLVTDWRLEIDKHMGNKQIIRNKVLEITKSAYQKAKGLLSGRHIKQSQFKTFESEAKSYIRAYVESRERVEYLSTDKSEAKVIETLKQIEAYHKRTFLTLIAEGYKQCFKLVEEPISPKTFLKQVIAVEQKAETAYHLEAISKFQYQACQINSPLEIKPIHEYTTYKLPFISREYQRHLKQERETKRIQHREKEGTRARTGDKPQSPRRQSRKAIRPLKQLKNRNFSR